MMKMLSSTTKHRTTRNPRFRNEHSSRNFRGFTKGKILMTMMIGVFLATTAFATSPTESANSWDILQKKKWNMVTAVQALKAKTKFIKVQERQNNDLNILKLLGDIVIADHLRIREGKKEGKKARIERNIVVLNTVCKTVNVQESDELSARMDLEYHYMTDAEKGNAKQAYMIQLPEFAPLTTDQRMTAQLEHLNLIFKLIVKTLQNASWQDTSSDGECAVPKTVKLPKFSKETILDIQKMTKAQVENVTLSDLSDYKFDTPSGTCDKDMWKNRVKEYYEWVFRFMARLDQAKDALNLFQKKASENGNQPTVTEKITDALAKLVFQHALFALSPADVFGSEGDDSSEKKAAEAKVEQFSKNWRSICTSLAKEQLENQCSLPRFFNDDTVRNDDTAILDRFVAFQQKTRNSVKLIRDDSNKMRVLRNARKEMRKQRYAIEEYNSDYFHGWIKETIIGGHEIWRKCVKRPLKPEEEEKESDLNLSKRRYSIWIYKHKAGQDGEEIPKEKIKSIQLTEKGLLMQNDEENTRRLEERADQERDDEHPVKSFWEEFGMENVVGVVGFTSIPLMSFSGIRDMWDGDGLWWVENIDKIKSWPECRPKLMIEGVFDTDAATDLDKAVWKLANEKNGNDEALWEYDDGNHWIRTKVGLPSEDWADGETYEPFTGEGKAWVDGDTAIARHEYFKITNQEEYNQAGLKQFLHQFRDRFFPLTGEVDTDENGNQNPIREDIDDLFQPEDWKEIDALFKKLMKDATSNDSHWHELFGHGTVKFNDTDSTAEEVVEMMAEQGDGSFRCTDGMYEEIIGMLDMKSGFYGDTHYFHEMYSGGQIFLLALVVLCMLCFFFCCGKAHLEARGYKRAEGFDRYTFAETFHYIPNCCIEVFGLPCGKDCGDIESLPTKDKPQCCFWYGNENDQPAQQPRC